MKFIGLLTFYAFIFNWLIALKYPFLLIFSVQHNKLFDGVYLTSLFLISL